MRARPLMPPTVPPAIAPAWEVERCDDDGAGAVALELELEEAAVGLLVRIARGGGSLGMRLRTATVCEMFDLHQ